MKLLNFHKIFSGFQRLSRDTLRRLLLEVNGVVHGSLVGDPCPVLSVTSLSLSGVARAALLRVFLLTVALTVPLLSLLTMPLVGAAGRAAGALPTVPDVATVVLLLLMLLLLLLLLLLLVVVVVVVLRPERLAADEGGGVVDVGTLSFTFPAFLFEFRLLDLFCRADLLGISSSESSSELSCLFKGDAASSRLARRCFLAEESGR